MKKFKGSPLFAVTFIFCLLSAIPVVAQPTNDDCTNAVAMSLDTLYTMNTADATSTGDPTNVCSAPFGKGVWFEFVAPRDGKLTLSTCGSDFDTLLQVYTGSCGSLNPVVCADDTGPVCDSDQASVSFLVGVGQHYLIVVGGYDGASGNLDMVATMDPPPNDQCSGAIPLTVNVPYMMNTASATTTNDPVPSCVSGFGKGVWFQFTATMNGPVTISTYGSDLYTALEVFTGDCNSLTPVTCNSQDGPGPGGTRATARFQGANGTTYLILVGGYYGSLKSGNIQVLAEEGIPANDLCSGAIPMDFGTTYTIRTTSATATGDPNPTCSYPWGFGNGVWYQFTPETNAVATISTCGSDFDTLFQVFTGSCGALTAITEGCSGANQSTCDTNGASTTFEVTGGVTYWILAGGKYGEGGNLNIQATLSAQLPNDRYTNAIPMAEGIVYTENTTLATSAGDPTYTYVCVANAAKGVWYSFTPTNDGVVTVSTCGSDFDTFMAIFTNNCIDCYSPPDGCNNDNGPACPGNRASVDFFGKAGATYLIFAAGNNGASGNLSIQATVQPPLANDQCTNAIELTNGIPFTMNTAAATSINDGSCLYNDGKGVWFSFTSARTNDIIISTDGSDYTPTIAVYEGECGHLTNVTCGSPGAYFTGNAGQKYLIEAGGLSYLGEMTGNLKISASDVPPSNDQCSGAISMATASNYVVNTTYATAANDPVPLCDSTAGHGVWYRYTPPTDAEITVKTCDSDFETVLQVYTGDCSSLTPVACNDGFGPACATNRASVSFFAQTVTNYYILVAGKNGAFGNLSITANGPPPANDNCDAAIDMTEGVTYATNTTYASSTGDVFPVTKGVWYRFTPTRPGLLLLSTCGSDFKTCFNVYTGTCNSLTYYNGSSDDSIRLCSTNGASAEFPVLPDTTYYIDAGGYIAGSGNLSITATMPPPTNDTCAGAIALANGVLYRMNTLNATETGDPTPLCQTNFGKGVWFTFTPPMSGTISISTCAGDLDTVLQVYTGGCSALTPVADSCNDDAGPDCDSFTASVHFPGAAGVTYWILVGGYGGAGGNLGIEANILPTLTMQRTGTNSVLYWPGNLSGYHPQFTTNLTPPVFWNTVTGTTGSKDGNWFVTNSLPGNAIFYRLEK